MSSTKRKALDEEFTKEDAIELKAVEQNITNLTHNATRKGNLGDRISSLEMELASLQAKLTEIQSNLKKPAAETVKQHIRLLHEYNAIKDIGQGLLGLIAEGKGITMREVHDEFGVGDRD